MSLLSSFSDRIKGSTEYLASESLNYIINNSQNVNNNIINLINLDTNRDYSAIKFLSQVQGENLEIPDLSGFNQNGEESIIIETKFWASLTENQPGTYLKRLSENGTLVFICPEKRTISLKGEIIHTLKEETVQFTDDNKVIHIENKSIVIYSWTTILDSMEKDIDNSEFQVRSDINQLRGLCKQVDSDSFLPISQKELSPEIPKRIMSYNDIVDKAIDDLVANKGFSTQGLKAAPQRWGYRRYAFIENLTIALDVNFDYWAKYVDTPIWLEISIDWKVNDVIAKMNSEIEKKYGKINCGSFGNRPYYPIRLKVGEVEDKVIASISEFIKSIYDIYLEDKTKVN